MIKVWNFCDFQNEDGKNLIRKWLDDDVPSGAQAIIDRRLRAMELMHKNDWPAKWIKKYVGLDKIYELRIKGNNNVQYRPLGVYHGKNAFVILIGAEERGDKIPRNILKTAQERLKKLEGDPSYATPHQFDDEID